MGCGLVTVVKVEKELLNILFTEQGMGSQIKIAQVKQIKECEQLSLFL